MGRHNISTRGTLEPSSENSRIAEGGSSKENMPISTPDIQAEIDDLRLENRILREALQIDHPTHTEFHIDFSSHAPVGWRSTAPDSDQPAGQSSRNVWPEAGQYPLAGDQASESLSCLFEIDRLASDSKRSLEEILQSIATSLPFIWPGKTVSAAGIFIGRREFRSTPSADGPPALETDLFILKRKVGSVFLHMKAPAPPPADSGPISENDRHLLNAVAEKIGFILGHHHAMGSRRRIEAKFQKIFDTNPDAIIISRLDDGRLVDVNEGFCILSGYRREEVIGKSSLALNLWWDSAQRREVTERLRREGQIQNAEVQFRRKDAGRLATLVSAARMDLKGQPCILSIVRDITDLKKAEAEQRRQKIALERQSRVLTETERDLNYSRERYYTLYHSAPVGYLTLDRAGRILEVNQTGALMLGLGPVDHPNRHLAQFVAQGDRPVLSAHLEEAFATGKRCQCIIQSSGRERKPVYLRVESLVQTDARTGERNCWSTMSDWTEMKKRDIALQASHRFLQIATAHSQLELTLSEFIEEIKALTGCRAVGIRMLGPGGDIPYEAIEGFCDGFREMENDLSVHRDQCLCIRVIQNDTNPRLPYFTPAGSFYTNSTSRLLADTHKEEIGPMRGTCNQLGYESVGLIPVKAENQTIGLIHVADRRKEMLSYEIVVLLEKAALQLGTSIQRVNAVQSLKEVNEMLEERVAERTAALQSSIELLKKEFQESDRMEKRLRDNKNRLQAVFDGISEPLVLIDQQMKVLTINKAAKDYFRLTERRAAIGRTCCEAFGQSRDFCDSCRIPEVMASGESAVFERTGLMDPERLEQVIVYPVVRSDVAERHAVIRISDITESRILERQLIQNEKMASLGMLVSSIAHELNNPNSFIAFNIPILKDYFEGILPIVDRYADVHPEFEVANMPYAVFREDAFRLFGNLEHGSMRISAFLANLREFVRSKPETGKKWVMIRQIVDQALSICRTKVQKTVKRLIVSLPEGNPSIFTSPIALEQILINIMVNAAQAADKPDSFIRLTVARREGRAPQWLFEIEDNGCGMDETTRQKIFDPFFSTKLNEGGSGLGLYICNRLVRELGGELLVESRPAYGSTFSVLLDGRETRDAKP